FVVLPRPPTLAPLFPYPTLFRSVAVEADLPLAVVDLEGRRRCCGGGRGRRGPRGAAQHVAHARHQLARRERLGDVVVGAELEPRSEEHTSELQSRENLVCRLLRE